MSTQPLPTLDQSALRVNQAFIIGLLMLAFILNAVWLVAFVALVMLVGTAVPRYSLFKLIYGRLLKPFGYVKPDIVVDNPQPHRFAQGLGGVFVALATLALGAGLPLVGWTLAWLVVALAGLNLVLGFCAGCFIYYQLNKIGLPGFTAGPLT